jgi:hypothetical protein
MSAAAWLSARAYHRRRDKRNALGIALMAVTLRVAFGREREEDTADREEKENREIDEATEHGDTEEENLPIEDLSERGAANAKQGEELFIVVGRRHKILWVNRPLDEKRETRREDKSRIDRQDQENDRKQREQQQ